MGAFRPRRAPGRISRSFLKLELVRFPGQLPFACEMGLRIRWLPRRPSSSTFIHSRGSTVSRSGQNSRRSGNEPGLFVYSEPFAGALSPAGLAVKSRVGNRPFFSISRRSGELRTPGRILKDRQFQQIFFFWIRAKWFWR